MEIDGELVVSDYFHIGTGHTVVPFGLSLSRGKHRIRIWSSKGDAELSREFELIDQDVGVVNYHYYPASQDNPMPRKFDSGIRKGPLWIDQTRRTLFPFDPVPLVPSGKVDSCPSALPGVHLQDLDDVARFDILWLVKGHLGLPSLHAHERQNRPVGSLRSVTFTPGRVILVDYGLVAK